MFLSCAKLFAPVALSLLLLPGTLAAQSPASIQPLAERQQKVLDALRNAKVKIPPGAAMPTFLSLLPAMKDWAALPDDPSPEEMTKLHDLIGATFPSHLERLARFNQLKVEAQEQPRTVLAYLSRQAGPDGQALRVADRTERRVLPVVRQLMHQGFGFAA